jgi:methanogenic corrinoid protein MtbC1
VNDRNLHKRLLADALSERYGLALLAGDPTAAEMIVREAYDEELPYGLIHTSIVAPAMQRIGVMWERGEISVAHEHVATQISLRVLALLRELFRVAHNRSDQRAMMAAVEGEQHIVALQMAADLLEDAGYEVLMLGPDVPVDALEEMVVETAPTLVGLTVTMSAAAGNLSRAVEAATAGDPTAGVIVGGIGRPRRLPDAPGIVTIDSVIDVVEIADRLVRRPELN